MTIYRRDAVGEWWARKAQRCMRRDLGGTHRDGPREAYVVDAKEVPRS